VNIVWSSEAIRDLISLRTYIAEESPAGARRVILQTVETLLPHNPQVGRPGRVAGTRELVIPRTPYIVPYRLQNQTIQILRVYHGAQRWPESF
jgi:toxin ParE1/3/4